MCMFSCALSTSKCLSSACCSCWFSHLLILDRDSLFVIRLHQWVQGQHSRLQFTFYALESQGETESFTERYPSCTEPVSYSWSCSISLMPGCFLWSCLERNSLVLSPPPGHVQRGCTREWENVSKRHSKQLLTFSNSKVSHFSPDRVFGNMLVHACFEAFIYILNANKK